MNVKPGSANITPDSRKEYQPLKLVQHGHFRDVVKDLDAAPQEGSQIMDIAPDKDPG